MMRNQNVTRPMGKFRVEGWLRAVSQVTWWARQERRLVDQQDAT
jgi:hypothetical protein